MVLVFVTSTIDARENREVVTITITLPMLGLILAILGDCQVEMMP